MIENYKGLHYELSFLKGGFAQLIAFKCINQKITKIPVILCIHVFRLPRLHELVKTLTGFRLEKVGMYLLLYAIFTEGVS